MTCLLTVARRTIRRVLSPLACFLVALPVAHAQLLEDADVKFSEREAAILLRLASPIQYLRHSPAKAGDLLRIEFQALGTPQSDLDQFEEYRRPQAERGLPAFRVIYLPNQGRRTTKVLEVRFDGKANYRVRSGGDNRSLQILVALPPPPAKAPSATTVVAPAIPAATAAAKAATAPPSVPAVPPAAAPAGPAVALSESSATGGNVDVEADAKLKYARAESALQAGQYGAAVEFLNQVLTLPPNAYSRLAQARIGDARARNGEIAKARIEYRLYLDLYPSGPETKQVQQALAKLDRGEFQAPESKPTLKVEDRPWTVSGGLVQSYNRGATKVESDTRTSVGSAVDHSAFTEVDQSALVSNVDLTARKRTEDYDHRLVFRDTNVQNFLDGSRDTNQVTSAYYEVKNLPAQWDMRLGRQLARTAGVFGRFDGVQAGMQVAQHWRLGIVGGEPVEFNRFDSKRRLYGLTLDLGPFANNWSGSAFAIEQRIDSLVDRRGVGGDLRYFDQSGSLYTLFDYDAFYSELDVFLVQGSRSYEGGWTLSGLYEFRKAPPLQTSNALLGETTTSVNELLLTMSREEVYALAEARTADSRQAYLGFTKQLGEHWQVGFDARSFNVGDLPPSGTLPATPSTGNVVTYGFQLIGSNLFERSDITVLNLSTVSSPTFDGSTVGINHLQTLGGKWTVEPSLRYYQQEDAQQVRLRRVSPTLRLYYRASEGVSLESELSWESTTTESALVTDRSSRQFVSVGYRWDF